MTASEDGFSRSLFTLWLRFSTVAIISLLFVLVLMLPERLVGWSFYLNSFEVAFEVAVFAVWTALASIIFASLATAAISLFLYRAALRNCFVGAATKVAVALAALIDIGFALQVALNWAHLPSKAFLAVCGFYVIAFLTALRLPRRRAQLVTSLDSFLEDHATRRTVLTTALAAATFVAADTALGKFANGPFVPRRTAPPSGPNILVVTFDALNAEDMSLYGYHLPTTPHIDAFAQRSSVFSNFYSASTFTTSSVATILTGLQPSEHHVYHLQGRFRGDTGQKTLPHLMREGGYATGASISNPVAYFLAQGIQGDYDALPPPAYHQDGFQNLWGATSSMHQRQPFGCRMDEFWALERAWDFLPMQLERYDPRHFGRTASAFPPSASFRQAAEMLTRIPEKFFVWVHLCAPHWPYLPDGANAGRFLPLSQLRTAEEQYPLSHFWPGYAPSQQRVIDKARLRYDEFIADADSAFGSFLGTLEANGKLKNTAVLFGADHGESFEGGIYTHDSRFLTRPQLHVPMVIHMPGQQHGSRIALTADQTSFATTVLDIAGLPRPSWMRGASLVPWLNRDKEGEGQGLAFSQYLSTNSVFKPVTKGTVGVIDGQHQYILDLDTGKGILRSLAEAQQFDLDRSAENPELARTLRQAIYARFPDLPRKST